MPLSGTLSTMNLSDILQWLQASRKSGDLSLTVNLTDTVLRFKEGDVEAMQGGGALQRDLGQQLVASGLIKDEVLLDTMQKSGPDKSLSDALLAQGLIDQQALHKAQKNRAMEHLLDLFFSEVGSFHFVEIGSSEDLLTPLQLDDDNFFTNRIETRSLLLEGMRRVDEWRRIREAFASDYTVIRAVPEQQSSNPVWVLLDQEKVPISCGEICLRLGGRRFEVYQAMYRAFQLGLVEAEDSDVSNPRSGSNQSGQLLVDSARLLLDEGQFTEAIELLNIANDSAAYNPEIHSLLRQAQNKQLAALYEEIPPHSRPLLNKQSPLQLQMDLSPRERYLAARLDGRWDVATLAMATPLGEIETLRALKKFLHAGQLKLLFK